MRSLVGWIVLAAAVAQAAKLPPPNKLALVQAQCGRCGCVLAADCGTGGACAGGVCTAGDALRVACQVTAECAAGQSCIPQPHQCSTLTLGSGTATLKSARQPAPTCPKRGEPTENRSGDVRLAGVMQNGAPYTGALTTEVVLKTSFGPDPNGTCALIGTQIEFLSVTGAVDCKAGKCKGSLSAVACLPKECADTPITSELATFIVRDPTGTALATPGIFLVPSATDAP